jgi:Flp pilus assembly protein TadG
MSSFLARVRDRRGQTLVELAIVIFVFVLLVLGAVDLGRAYMIANVVTHAARDGARSAAVVPAAGRDATSGIIDSANQSRIKANVLAQISNVMRDVGSIMTVTIGFGTTPPVVKVTVTGEEVPFLFNLPGLGASFRLTREVTFRDEGR